MKKKLIHVYCMAPSNFGERISSLEVLCLKTVPPAQVATPDRPATCPDCEARVRRIIANIEEGKYITDERLGKYRRGLEVLLPQLKQGDLI